MGGIGIGIARDMGGGGGYNIIQRCVKARKTPRYIIILYSKLSRRKQAHGTI